MKFASLLSLWLAGPIAAQVDVLTWQYDNGRSGLNSAETALTPLNVNSTQFGKLFSASVDGYIYAQPLYLSNVAIPGKGTHNVVYVVTEHDSVYAFDADTAGPPLWQTNFLGAGVTTVSAGDVGCSQIAPEIGITSTPVIDPARSTIYVVAMTKEAAGGATSYVHRLHALDLATGAEKPASPVVIQATYPGTGEGGTTLTFAPRNYKQRPGLLLLNGIVYTTWSSHCDIGRYHGWVIGYDAATLQQVVVWNNTPNGNAGSFWQAGAAPAADDAGNIYVVAGNGSFDYAAGGANLGEAYIKLSSSTGIAVADYFTPFNYANLNSRDLDVGSSGVAFLGDEAGSDAHPHLMAGAGKEGRVYLLDRDGLGGVQSGSDSQIAGSSGANAIGGLFGNPAYFNHTLYFCGSGDNLKAWSVWDAVLSSGLVSVTQTRFASPGCLPSISANGDTDAIVWTLDAANMLHAYDARNLAIELYNSNQNSAGDALGSYVKFTVPMVANGKVYTGTQKALVVYGLIPGAPSATLITNAASFQRNRAAPGSIISIFGANLTGASVSINGVAAPILSTGDTRIDVQVPFDIQPGAATVQVGPASLNVTIASTAPGIYLSDQLRAAATNPDGSVNNSSQRAPAGGEVEVYLTGLGAVDSSLFCATAKVSATIGGQNAPVAAACLASGNPGLYLVDLTVPQLPAGDYPLQITAGGVASNTAVLSVQ